MTTTQTHTSTTGRVVYTSSPHIQVGRVVTLTQDAETISIVQDGTPREQWNTDDATVSVARTDVPERYTPGWAIALGILGILFFLIGILFFFVKETRYVPRITTTLTVAGRPVVTIETNGAVASVPVTQN